jgi:hypothetical protein
MKLETTLPTENVVGVASHDLLGVRFGSIKRGARFIHNGEEWVRTRGTFAMRVREIGTGAVGWPFKVATIVLPPNARGMARELAALDSNNSNDING